MLLSHRPEPTVAPETLMVGTCATCGAAVTKPYYEVTPSRSSSTPLREPGFWTDLPCTECPRCKARVYLRRATP